MRFLSLRDVLTIQRVAIHKYGGSHGIRDLGLLESALAAPRHTMFGEELYPDLASKCAILLYLLIENHWTKTQSQPGCRNIYAHWTRWHLVLQLPDKLKASRQFVLTGGFRYPFEPLISSP